MNSLAWALLAAFVSPAAPALGGVFPFPVHKKTLPNGLDLVVIEMPEFKGVLSHNTMVLAGSGREVEPGKTGLAHLFEHILFRHRFGGKENGYSQGIEDLGAHNNAWTWYDVTYYHPLSFRSNLDGRKTGSGDLPGLAELEAERFVKLEFTEKIFKTESGAVLGEYRRGASAPSLKMSEKLLAELFGDHPYGHTTLGTYADVLDMPNEHAAALKFYDEFYRPNNCFVVLAGDLRASEIFERLGPVYASWQAKQAAPAPLPREPSGVEVWEHVDWDADVAPQLWVAYRMPAFAPGSKDGAVAQLLQELTVAPAAPLYKELRYEKQSVSDLGFGEGRRGFESVQPRALTIAAELYQDRYARLGRPYFEEVRADIARGFEALKTFSRQPEAKKLLDVVKSKYRYDFLAELASPAEVAANFAWYYRFGRDPKVLDRLLDSVAGLEPADIDAFAEKVFRPANRVVVSMAYKAAGVK